MTTCKICGEETEFGNFGECERCYAKFCAMNTYKQLQVKVCAAQAQMIKLGEALALSKDSIEAIAAEINKVIEVIKKERDDEN